MKISNVICVHGKIYVIFIFHYITNDSKLVSMLLKNVIPSVFNVSQKDTWV